MSEKITPRAQDFSQWYQDIVLQARLADYSPVKGCMVIRENGYAIWERIQKDLDRRIKETGAKNYYFPNKEIPKKKKIFCNFHLPQCHQKVVFCKKS